jgi:Phage stabilisation protein
MPSIKTPILGSTYVARSVNAADSVMINLFPEIVPEGGKEPAFLQRCPGLKFQQFVGTGPIRGLWVSQTYPDNFYVASGNQFYKLTSLNGTPVRLGAISGTGPVSIADNGTQLFIACGIKGYIYNQSTNVFAEITDPDFPGAETVTYLDGYFVFNEPDSQKIWITQLLDGESIDPLDFASAEGSPDGVVGVLADHRELWIFGTDTTEVWYNSGVSDFPLSPIQGAFNEIGCASAFSVAKLDNSIFWLGSDPRGRGIVYRADGYRGVRVSTHAVEWQIQQYPRIDDAVAYSYQQDGHGFYVLNFPSADRTWVYDASTKAWHERAGWKNSEFTRHRSNCQCNYQGNIVIGDYQNGNIYTFDLDTYADNGQIQRWLRSWRALSTGQNNLNRTAQHHLQLDLETGVGLNLGQGSDPEVMLRWSDDGGHTWSNEHWVKVGKIGQYGKRAIWRRLGMTEKIRDRVYEVSMTDPVKTAIMGAELFLTPTSA